MFEDKEVGFAVTRQAHHSAVIVLNPAAQHFPAHQLDGHRRLLLAQSLEVSGLLMRVVGWRSLGLVRVVMIAGPLERHAPILHGGPRVRPVQDPPSTVASTMTFSCTGRRPPGSGRCPSFAGSTAWKAATLTAHPRECGSSASATSRFRASCAGSVAR